MSSGVRIVVVDHGDFIWIESNRRATFYLDPWAGARGDIFVVVV